MAGTHPYVISSEQTQIYFTPQNLPSVRVGTGTAINFSDSQTLTEIYAIGTREPIDVVDINAQYNGTLTFQTGDYEQLLNAINGNLAAGETPYATLSRIPAFSVSITVTLSNAAVPITVSTTLVNCKMESRSSDYNRNDPETLTTISFRGTGLARTVSPIG